jgi:rhamnulokinase
MPAAIQAVCARTGQAVPQARQDVLRVALESLAWRYRRTLRDLERLLGARLEVIHVVGGGSQNRLLCQMTADACGRPVLAGPVEATAIGNVAAQAIAAGELASWDDARQLVRDNFPLRAYQPAHTADWDEASPRLERILDGGKPPC